MMAAEQAQQYTSVSSLQYESGLKLLDALNLRPGDHVLDLGCGTGNVTQAAAQRVAPNGRVVGLDPDHERILTARARYGDNGNLEFVEGRAESLPEGLYDVVFSNYVLHWIEDKKAVFERMYRSLKVGGRFGIVAMLGPPVVLRQLRLLMDPTHSSALAERLYYVPRETYEQLALSCGFSVERCQVNEVVYRFPNAESLYRWYSASTHGAFNPEFIERVALEEFEKQFMNKSVEVDFSPGILTIIVSKSSMP